MGKPHRAFELEIKIGADTRKDIDGALNDIWFQLKHEKKGENAIQSITGGSSAGYSISLIHDPEMTHDKYFEIIEKLKAEKKNKKQQTKGS